MTHAFQGNYQNKINQAICFIVDQLIQNNDYLLLFTYLFCARNSIKIYYINPVWQLLNLTLQKKQKLKRGYMARIRSLGFKAKSGRFQSPALYSSLNCPQNTYLLFYCHSFTSEFLFRTHSQRKSQNFVLSTTNKLFPSFEELLLMLYVIQYYENQNVCLYVGLQVCLCGGL